MQKCHLLSHTGTAGPKSLPCHALLPEHWICCDQLLWSFVDATSTLEYSAALHCCNYNALESEVADDVSTVFHILLSYCKSDENILEAIINQVERESECE